MAEANSFNTDLPTNILPTELTNELINDGLRQFWEILLTSRFGYAENVSRCSQWILFASSRIIKGTWVYKSYLGKDYEVLENYRYRKLSKLRELQSIVCLLLNHIQQSYKKYAFHIRLSALKQGSAPMDSHFKNHGILVRTAFQASDWEKWEEKRQRLR